MKEKNISKNSLFALLICCVACITGPQPVAQVQTLLKGPSLNLSRPERTGQETDQKSRFPKLDLLFRAGVTDQSRNLCHFSIFF